MLQHHEQAQSKVEIAANFALGFGGITIGLQDITNIAQAIAAVAGAVLVCIQLYRTLRKKK